MNSDQELRHAQILNNLAYSLLCEVQAAPSPLQRLKEAVGHGEQARQMRLTRLAEARGYAEQALAIKESLDPSSSAIWATLGILASIAHLEGRIEEARTYRRREQETYAAIEGNRYRIDRLHGRLIVDIAAAARGSVAALIPVTRTLPLLKKQGWRTVPAIQRILDGERNWPLLAENLDGKEALFVKRVLEIIENPHDPLTMTHSATTVKRIMSHSLSDAFEHGDVVHLPALIRDALRPEDLEALPADFREAIEQGNSDALKQAFRSLPPAMRRAVEDAVVEGLRKERRDGRLMGMPPDEDSLWE